MISLVRPGKPGPSYRTSSLARDLGRAIPRDSAEAREYDPPKMDGPDVERPDDQAGGLDRRESTLAQEFAWSARNRGTRRRRRASFIHRI